MRDLKSPLTQSLANPGPFVHRVSTLSNVNNLGLLYADQGKLKEAEAMYSRALVGREKGEGLRTGPHSDPQHRQDIFMDALMEQICVIGVP